LLAVLKWPFVTFATICIEVILNLLLTSLHSSSSTIKMSRGGSAGGGQSSLGYLFGGSEPSKPAVAPAAPAAAAPAAPAEALPAAGIPTEKVSPVKGEVSKQIPAGIPGSQTNNYQRADGQNTGNFLTVWLFLLLFTCEIDRYNYDSVFFITRDSFTYHALNVLQLSRMSYFGCSASVYHVEKIICHVIIRWKISYLSSLSLLFILH
jgi:SPIRAL1-like protein